jgi:hypothetical protein
MRLPGFSADRSVYRTSGHYRAAMSGDGSAGRLQLSFTCGAPVYTCKTCGPNTPCCVAPNGEEWCDVESRCCEDGNFLTGVA